MLQISTAHKVIETTAYYIDCCVIIFIDFFFTCSVQSFDS